AFGFTPDDNGTYVVTLTATDKDGAVGMALSRTITVTNVDPTVVPPAVAQGASEGALRTFSLGSFTDPGADGAWTVEVDWGDGSGHTQFTAANPGALGTATHAYANSGSYTVTVKLTDKDTASGTNSFPLVVNNAAPTVSITGAPSGGPEGTAITLGSTTDDVSPADLAQPFRYTWTVTRNGAAYVTS